MRPALLRSQTDERLVALARQGHARAFEAIVGRYERPLRSACSRIVPDAPAREVLEPALAEAWTRVRSEDVGRPGAWLFGIVRDGALRRSAHALVHAAAGDAGDAERRAVVHATLGSFARLPERRRAALLRTAVPRDAPKTRFHGAHAIASALVPLPVLARLAGGGADAPTRPTVRAGRGS